MTDCTEYEVLLSLRLDGELTPDEDARLTAHLTECPSCQSLAAELESLHSELEAIAPVPPASLAENVMKQVRAAPGTAKRRKRYGALAALLALVILGGSVFSVSPFGPFHAAGSAPDWETAAVTEEAPPTEDATDSPAEAVPAEVEDIAESAPVEERADTANAGEAGGGAIHPYSYTAEPVPPLATEPAAVETEEPPILESAADESSDAAESPKATNTAAASLSKSKARSRLQALLNNKGGSWTVTDSGQSADGTEWLFTAEEAADQLPHYFSVSIPDGQVTELPQSD